DLRQGIIKTWAPDIDSDTLKSHLAPGYGRILGRVLSREVYQAAPFASPNRTLEEVARGWRDSYGLFSGPVATREAEKAERELAEHMTDEARKRLQADRREFLAVKEHALDHERDDLVFRKSKGRK